MYNSRISKKKFFSFIFFIYKARIEESLKETQLCFNNKNPIHNRQYYIHSEYFIYIFSIVDNISKPKKNKSKIKF